jgi:hypothetical protein
MLASNWFPNKQIQNNEIWRLSPKVPLQTLQHPLRLYQTFILSPLLSLRVYLSLLSLVPYDFLGMLKFLILQY